MRKTILFFTILILCASSVYAENQATIFYVKGKPGLMKEGLPGWKPCKVGAVVDSGDRIKTDKDEAVEISLLADRSNIVRIEENSDAYIRKSTAPYRIELLNGATMALIKKLPKGSTFEIATPAGLSGARGTGWRSSTTGASADFQCYENAIYVTGIDQNGNKIEGTLTVESGYETFLNQFEKPEKLGQLSNADLQKWNEWKNDLLGRIRDLERNLDRAGNLQGNINQIESQKSDVKESLESERSDEQQQGSSHESNRDKGGPGDYTPPK